MKALADLEKEAHVLACCASCKHWLRGTWRTYSPDLRIIIVFTPLKRDGPHPKAGTTEWVPVTRWDCHADGQNIGECTVANDKISVATCDSEGIYGELMTDETFSCCKFEPYTDRSEQERTHVV